jgi:hypothetical protein
MELLWKDGDKVELYCSDKNISLAVVSSIEMKNSLNLSMTFYCRSVNTVEDCLKLIHSPLQFRLNINKLKLVLECLITHSEVPGDAHIKVDKQVFRIINEQTKEEFTNFIIESRYILSHNKNNKCTFIRNIQLSILETNSNAICTIC